MKTKIGEHDRCLWNIRGLNKYGRINYLVDFIKQNKLDFVGIQDTKKLTLIAAL
jgi:exonuclease III